MTDLPRPIKKVIPRPQIRWYGGTHTYNWEVKQRTHYNLLKTWKKEVANEEKRYIQRLLLWKNERDRLRKNENQVLLETPQPMATDDVVVIIPDTQEHYDECSEDEIV